MADPRTHTASRTIIASPRAIFRAFLDAEAVASWRAPKGMTAKILAFDPRVGGGYRMALVYSETDHSRGKRTTDTDIVVARFIELIPNEKIVEAVEFESDDPALVGTMTMTAVFTPIANGTKVTFTAETVPTGISDVDHRTGMDSSLKNLANLVE